MTYTKLNQDDLNTYAIQYTRIYMYIHVHVHVCIHDLNPDDLKS